jgi:hypothetical protein
MPKLKHAAANAAITAASGINRSPLWNETRKNYLVKFPKCAVCGDSSNVEVHHKFPFHFVVAMDRPDLELDEDNFITLCEDTVHDHHLLIGHVDDWKSFNHPANPKQLDAFVTRFKGKDENFIKADATFKAAHAAKPPHLEKMSAADIQAFKLLLLQTIPIKPAIMQKAKAARGIV